MNNNPDPDAQTLPSGVMLNAYPDSIGERLADTVALLERPELKDAFSLFYILPTFFNSDLDRGFSIIDYGINQALVSAEDLAALNTLGITFKLDLVLNHLSVRSPQFQDLLLKGDDSIYKDFFLDWNAFWLEHGTLGPNGMVTPKEEHLGKLFMRKPGLPILRVCFPDGSYRPYWNTFYQEVKFVEIGPHDFVGIDGIHLEHANAIAAAVHEAIEARSDLEDLDLGPFARYRDAVLSVICQKRDYLGQMDLNARSELVWAFYDETLKKLKDYGAKIIRLDAFAYLHKEAGEANFFNRPGTWNYLERLREMARKYDLIIFPEVHAEYGTGIHEEVAEQGYPDLRLLLPRAGDRCPGPAGPIRRCCAGSPRSRRRGSRPSTCWVATTGSRCSTCGARVSMAPIGRGCWRTPRSRPPWSASSPGAVGSRTCSATTASRSPTTR